MAKYPFTPALLDSVPEQIAELFRALEDTLLGLICSRLTVNESINQATLQDIQALRAQGVSLEEITRAIQQHTGISEERLQKILDEAVERNKGYYAELIDLAGLTEPEHLVNTDDIAIIEDQAFAELRNITRSMGFLVDGGHTMLPPAEAYQWALDNATMQVQSGAIGYGQAIHNAVQQLADSGLMVDRKGNQGFVQYESGHRDHIDVAARRAVLTGVAQICGKYTEATADFLDTPYFEVSAHAGARDVEREGIPWSSHKAWQGRVYSVRADDIYPNIYAVCGLGEVDGLEGANCRHIRSVWVEGVSERTYTDEELENIDKPPFEFEGRRYTTYEATQFQRRMERTVRKLKRRKRAFETSGDPEGATAAGARIRILEEKYHKFSKRAGLREQKERMNVVYDKNSDLKSQKQSGKIEMYHRDNDGKDGFVYISDRRFDQLTIEARKNGAEIIRGTPEVEKHLEDMGATASSAGNILFFKKNVTVSEVLEETRHFDQYLSGLNTDKGAKLMIPLNEIEAKQFVIDNAAKYKVPRKEVEHLRKQIESYKKELDAIKEEENV